MSDGDGKAKREKNVRSIRRRIDSIKFENNIRSIGTHKFPFDHYNAYEISKCLAVRMKFQCASTTK